MLDVARSIIARFNHHHPITTTAPKIDTTQLPPPGENRGHTFWQFTSHPRIASRMARKDRES
jgi:hypothetical protein